MKVYHHIFQSTYNYYNAMKLHFRNYMSVSKNYLQFKENSCHNTDVTHYKFETQKLEYKYNSQNVSKEETTSSTSNFFVENINPYLAAITGIIIFSIIGKFFLQEDEGDGATKDDSDYNKDRVMKQETQIKFATWNIDTSLNIEANYAGAFEEWRMKNRIPHIIKFIEKVNPDILHLQEVRKKNYDGELINSLDPIKDFLETQGYEVLLCPYNSQDDFFQYITAYKSEKFKILGSTIESIEGSSRCIFITKLKHIHTEQDLYTFNIHMDPEKNKIEGSHMINQLVTQYITEQPTLKIIIAGDFNSFSDTNGNEQMQILTGLNVFNRPLLDVTSNLLLPDESPIPDDKTTFFYYPYDFNQKISSQGLEAFELRHAVRKKFSSECKAKGGHLDHIFVYNLVAKGAAILEVSPQFEPLPLDYTEAALKDYIVSNIDRGPAFLSDHQLIWVHLSFTGESHNYDE